MSEHFRTLSAVLPVVLREREGREEVLLLRRANTHYMDGRWDFAGSGHVEAGETASQALCRELLEETGLVARPGDVTFLHVAHRVKEPTYYDFTLRSGNGRGSPPSGSRTSAAPWPGFPPTTCPKI